MAQFIPFTPEEQEEYKKKAGLLPSTGVVEPAEPKRATGSFVPLEPEEQKGILADRLVLAAREGYEEQPEDYARRLQLARSNGWPEWMVSDPEVRKEAELNELGRKLTELPEDYSRTSSVLGIPRNFTLFRDDVETLKGVEDAVKGASAVTPMGRATVAFDEPEKDPVAEFFSHSGKGFSNVMELYRYAELSAKERTEGLADEEQAEWDALQSRLVPEEAPSLWEQVQQGAGSSLAFQGRPLSRFLSRWGIPLALATAGAAALAGTGGTAAPLIGALAPAAKALALGGAIGATGYRVQSFMDYQGLATELSYRTLSQMTDDRGVPYAEILGEGTISRLARGIGLAAATMESVGLEAVLGMVPGIGSLLPAKGMTRSVLLQPTIQKAILTGLANAFRTWSVEVGTEVAEQAVTTGGEEFAKWMVEQSGGRVSYADAGEWAARLGEEAVGAGASFLLGVGVGPGMMNVAGNVAQVNAAKRAQGTFLTLVELAEQSRGFKRSPDDGASVVSGIVAGSPVETTYVAARQFVEAYQQLGADPAVVAETLGVSRESLAEALETEGRIAVPTGEWTAKVAGTEAGRALLGDLTFESDGMTLREAQVAERELTELMRREAKAAEEAFKADEVLNQELESVRTDFLTQATGAGLDAETAQADAEVWAAFARTAYRRFGIRPREFSDMVGLEIRRGQEAAAGEGYSQVDAKALDSRYFAAVEAGDMEAAQAIVDEAARAAGYGSGEDYRMQHRAPNREDYSLAGIRESDLVPGDFWTHPEWYQGSSEEQEAFWAVLDALERDEARRGPGGAPGLATLTVYRAVPKGVKEGSFRNGDWVTPSRAYAELEGAGIRGGFRIIEKRVPLKDLWWDGNSIAELGYDDGESYVYRNTRNNRKLSGPVVRDMAGNVVPPSRRFKPRKAETFYQTAFHGSPYRFSRFSLDHVGGGEGAQAFGWGLYFAGSRDVAEWYRSKLQDGSPIIKNDDVIYMDTNDGWRFSSDQISDDWSEFNVNIPEVQAEVDGLELFRAFGYDQDAAEEAIDRALQHPEAVSNAILGDILDSREGRARLERAREFLGNSDLQTAEPGQLYAVDIPGSEDLLDWDKPLSEQGSIGERAWQAILARFGDDERLQEAFRFETMSPEEYKTYLVHEGYGSRRGWELRDGSVYRGDGEVVPEAAVAEQMKKDKGSKVFPSFGALYQTLSDTLGSQQEASRFLADAADIRGIQYLDGGSRGGGEGTHNYVIFDDAAIDVLETFYQVDAEARLSRDVASWSERVDQFLDRSLPRTKPLFVMTTPLALHLAGAEVLPVSMRYGVLEKVLRVKHKIPAETLKQLPGALADPIMIFDSATTPGSLVVMVELTDPDGATLVVPLRLNKKRGRYEIYNEISSVYGRKKQDTQKPNDQWFGDQVKEGRLRYMNTKKSSPWLDAAGLDLPGGGAKQSFLSRNIPTESDLVKLKAAMPGHYQQARGQAAFPSGQSIVTLFETADRSTLLHEMGHVFLNGLGLMAQRNEAAATEWAVVMDFLGVDDWDALTPEERTEAHEAFARAFEAYLMEGKAPSTALQRAFRMFKGWLIDIYRDLMGLSRQAGRDVALSDEARDIFNRLLATDEEIAEAEALAPFLAAVEATDESRELHREATAQAAEEAGRIRSAAEMRARRKEVAAQVRQELEASRGYRALFAMQRSADKGGRKINEDEFIERYGEMAWSESARPLGITSKRSTWALDDLALSLGYLTADEMVEEVLALPPLKDALAAQVDLVMAQEAQQEALSAEAALRNDARLEALILEHDSLAGDGPDIPRNDADAPAWVQLLEEVEAEEQNPLSRENLLAEIRERGGIRYESIKALWGPGEAKALLERLGPGPFRKDGRGLDQLVDELRADGVPVESTQALYDILLGEGGPQRQELDVAVDAESLPWLVWMLGRDETRDYLGKRRRTVRKALKEATDAFEADRSDEARQARVAAQRELDYIEAALTELEKDVDPDARYRVDFDPATLGQPREGRATWSQPTVREALAEQMKGTDPVKMRDAWALASRIARSAVGESRKQAREAQKALREQVREAARARQDFQAQQRATVRARVEAARVSARKVLENRKASEVNPREFIRAEREAARNVERALKDNNFDEAARQKDIEIINAALAYEAGRTKLEVGKIRAYLDKMAKRRKPGALGVDYLDRIHAVLEGVDFKKTRSRKAEQELAGFLEWKKEQESLGEVVAVPDRLVEQMGRVRFDSLTVDELRELHDAVRNLEHLGRTKTRLLTDRRKRDFETAVGDLLKSVDENLGAPYKTDLTPDKTLGQKAASALRAADAMHRRMEFLLRKLDGNRDLGTAWDLIFRPIVDAERAEIVLREEAAQRLQALFERLGKVNLQSKRLYREVGLRLSRENLLAIALNMGNEGNRDRLLSGHGWSEAQVMGLLQHLSRGEWEWVQGVWDFLDSFWPQVAALEKEMAGVEPRRVERMPFVARASDGSEIELGGGYYPIVYDASKSPQAFEIEEKRHVQDAMATQSYRAATRHGHTKARAGHAEIPLSLNLSTISRHVQEVVHDLTHRRAIRDVGRILEDRRVQKAITEALGAEYWREFKPWLKHVAAGRDVTPLNAWEQFLSHTRQGVTIATLGAKATTAIMQVMSIFGAAERIGALHMMNSIQEFYRNPAAWREKAQFVYDRSPEIRNRRRNWDRDVRDTLARNVGKDKKARVLEMAFWAAGMMDAAAVVPTWREAYQMKLAETGSEETAIHFADSVVRQTQPANSPKDLASVMRGHETRKLFTMFYSYWSVFYNLAASRIGATKRIGDLPRLAGSFLFMVAVPAVLGPLLTRRGPDDDEDPLGWAAKQIMLFPFNALVGVRDVASAIANPRWGYSLTPASRGFESAVNLAVQAHQALVSGDDWSDVIRPAVDLIGIWGHLPTDQARVTIGQFLRYLAGDMPDYDIADVLFRHKD